MPLHSQILRLSAGGKSDSVNKKGKESFLQMPADAELHRRMLAELIILRTVGQGKSVKSSIFLQYFLS